MAIKVYRANVKVEPLGVTVMVRPCNSGVTLTLIVVTHNLVVITVLSLSVDAVERQNLEVRNHDSMTVVQNLIQALRNFHSFLQSPKFSCVHQSIWIPRLTQNIFMLFDYF